jgi:hypothetical protein
LVLALILVLKGELELSVVVGEIVDFFLSVNDAKKVPGFSPTLSAFFG